MVGISLAEDQPGRHSDNPAELGCWASHLEAWRRADTLRWPVISLEADVQAVRPWPAVLPPDVLRSWDVLLLHDHAVLRSTPSAEKKRRLGLRALP